MARGIGNRQKKVVTPKRVWVKPAAKPRIKGRPEKPASKRD